MRRITLDTETTGLEPETHQCIEVGSILFHVESRSILAQNSFLIPSQINSAEAINKIPARMAPVTPFRQLTLLFGTKM